MLDQSEKRNDRFSIEIVAQLVKRVLPRKFDRYFLEIVYIYISVQLFSKLRQKAYVFPPRKLVVLKEESEWKGVAMRRNSWDASFRWLAVESAIGYLTRLEILSPMHLRSGIARARNFGSRLKRFKTIDSKCRPVNITP